jgi:hypothetical protein
LLRFRIPRIVLTGQILNPTAQQNPKFIMKLSRIVSFSWNNLNRKGKPLDIRLDKLVGLLRGKPIRTRGNSARPSELKLRELTVTNPNTGRQPKSASAALGYKIGKEAIRLLTAFVGKN